MKEEKIFLPVSGYWALFLILLLIGFPIVGIVFAKMIYLVIFAAIGLLGIGGFVIVNPNE